MDALLTAIANKLLASAVSNDVGGRCYRDTADSQDTPYLVYSIISAVPEKTFSEHYHEVLIQFDLFSPVSAGRTAITTMYADLVALLDECALTITGYTLVWCREQNLVTFTEDASALQDGTNLLFHYCVDFEIRVSLN
jgi:hypothetical protein